MKCGGVIFDLDGTLWDASYVTARTWVEVLAGHPEVHSAEKLTRDTVIKYMGLTNEELAEIFFPSLDYEKAFSLMQESCNLENLWLPTEGGILFDGVEETLHGLHERGYKLYIVSNCQDGYIEAFLTAHKMYGLITDWESSGRSGKNKAENIKDIVRRNGIVNPVYVGDTISDYNGARGAGVPFIYAKYGFGELVGRGKCTDFDESVDKISDLPEILEYAEA